jgi:hypothetical protein
MELEENNVHDLFCLQRGNDRTKLKISSPALHAPGGSFSLGSRQPICLP